MVKKSLKLKLDTRERKEPRIKRCLQQWCKVEYTTLKIGDITSEHCIVERKSFVDYVASLVDGRLFSQAKRMFETGKPSFIVVHDEPYDTGRITDNQLYGSIAALLCENGVPVFWSPSLSGAMYCAYSLCKKVEEGKYLKPRRPYKRPKRGIPAIIEKIAKYFGVSRLVAARLIKRYGSFHGICHAKQSDLRRVSGVGSIRAKQIYTLCNKNWRK